MGATGHAQAETPSTTGTRGAPKAEPRKLPPRNGRAYVGLLVGGYKQTRLEIARTLLDRYGIDCKHYYGLEKKTDPSPFKLYPEVEVVVFLDGDVDVIMPRVQRACDAAHVTPIGIVRGKDHTWDSRFKLAGYERPPRWRDGFDIDKVWPEQKLDHIDPPRLIYEDPALVAQRERRALEAANPTPEPEPVVVRAPKPAVPAPVPTPAEERRAPVSVPVVSDKSFAQFSKNVIAARERAGLTRAEFAKEFKMTAGGVSNWENCKGGMPYFEYYARLNKKWPDLFPPVRGLKGELKAQKEGRRLITVKEANTVVVPPPATPYVPPMQKKGAAPAAIAAPAPASLPVIAPPAPVVGDATMDDYLAALTELKAADLGLRQAEARRAEALALVDAIHKKVTGR
jgi:hypothetical protein